RDFHVTGVQTCALPILPVDIGPPVRRVRRPRPEPAVLSVFLRAATSLMREGSDAQEGRRGPRRPGAEGLEPVFAGGKSTGRRRASEPTTGSGSRPSARDRK